MQHNNQEHLQKAYVFFAQAEKERRENRFSKAINYYEQVLKLHPTYARAHLGKAQCSYQLAVQAKAAKSSFTAIFADTDHSKHLDSAIASANTALELDPGLTSAHVLLGALFGAKRSYANAHTHFAKALELNPKENIYAQRGWIFSSENRLMEALEDFQKAVELDPKDVKSWRGAANLYQRQNKPLEAMECLANVPSSDKANQITQQRFFTLLQQQSKENLLEYINELSDRRALRLIAYIYKNYYAGSLSSAIVSFSQPMDVPEHKFLSFEEAEKLYQNNKNVMDYLSIAKTARRLVMTGHVSPTPRLFMQGNRDLRVKLTAAAANYIPQHEALEVADKQLSIYEKRWAKK